jgi:oligosaccharide repeat unit polymerase
MQKFGMGIFHISIPTILILSMFVYAYVGLLPLYFGWDQYRYDMGIQDRGLVLQVLLMSMWSIFGLIAGFTYARYVLKMKTLVSFDRVRPIKRLEVFSLILLMILAYLVLLIYLKQVPKTALSVILTNGASTASHLARSEMGNNFSGKYHWYKLFFSDVFTIVTWAFFSAYLLTKRKSTLFLFLIAFVGASFAAVMATKKGPFAQILIGLLLTYALTKLKGKIPIKASIIFFTVLFSVLISFYIFFMGSNNVLSATGSIFSRALAGSIQPAYYYLQYFPTEHDFLLGQSFPNPGHLMPYTPFPLTKEIMTWVNPNSDGIVGTMPTVFWAEAYANFGYWGVFLVPFLMGVIVYTFNYYFSKLENTPIKIGFYIWLTLHLKTLSITGFSVFLYNFSIVAISIIIFSAILMGNSGKIRFYSAARVREL